MDQRRGIFAHLLETSWGVANQRILPWKIKDSHDYVQRLKLDRKVKAHDGCVNTISWNETGDLILSGSDDHNLCITNPFKNKVLHTITSGHRANIFSAKFLPNTRDKQLVSCSGDGIIIYTHLDRLDQGYNSFDCHFGTTYEVLTVPQDSHSFLSCGEDGTVRWFDLRIKDKCEKEDCKEDVLINCRRAITSIAVNPYLPYQLALGASDSAVRIFDRRMLGTKATGNSTGNGITGMISRFTAPNVKCPHRITSLEYSPDGEEVLVSYSSDYLYLFNLNDPKKDLEMKRDTHTKDEASSEVDREQSDSNGGRHPPVKKLRLRGDWSDTGPNARPEGERENTAAASTGSSNIMQRMSDMLTRWFEGINRQQDDAAQGQQSQGQSSTAQNPDETDNQGAEPQRETVIAETVLTEKSISHEAPVAGTEPVASTSKMSLDCKQTTDKKLERKDNSGETQRSSRSTKDKNEQISDKVPDIWTEEIPSDKYTSADSNVDSEECDTGTKTSKEQKNTNNVSEEVTVTSETDIAERVESSECIQDDCDMLSAGEEVTENDTVQSESDMSTATTSEGDQEGAAGNNGPPLPPTSTTAQSNMDRYLIVPQGVNNLEEHLSQQQYTPVISLHYCAAGTSTSTIKVDFTALNERQAANVASNSSVLRVRSSGSNTSANSTSTTTLSSSTEGPSVSHSTDILTSNNDSHSGRTGQDVSTGESSSQEARAASNVETAELSTMLGMVESCSNETTNTESNENNVQNQSDIQTESTQSAESEDATDKPDDVAETSSNSNTSTNTEEENTSSHDLEFRGPRRLSMRSSGQTGISSGNVRPGISGIGMRQRRYGHSGPPTGNFTLDSGSESDPDSDEELAQADRRKREGTGGLDRNAAATRLQQLFRKRREEKQKEEQEMNCGNVHQPEMKQCYRGHRNARTMIKESNFWGNNYVMSGSDCGHIFIWDRYTARLVMLLEGDRHVVNCVQPHPVYPVLATSGIDYDVKLWMPTGTESLFDQQAAQEVIKRNEVMLEETRDTITVPASFMLRMLASLNHLRTGRRAFGVGRHGSDSSSEDDVAEDDR